MCLSLYIASAKPLPLIPFDPEHPSFHVIELPTIADRVRIQFRHPNVYCVRSHQGCSCAFNYEHDFEPIRSLARYLKIVFTGVDELEGFTCRSGHEEDEVKHSTMVSPETISMPRFYFHDGHFLRIVPSLNSLGTKPTPPESCAPGLMAESFMGVRSDSTAVNCMRADSAK